MEDETARDKLSIASQVSSVEKLEFTAAVKSRACTLIEPAAAIPAAAMIAKTDERRKVRVRALREKC